MSTPVAMTDVHEIDYITFRASDGSIHSVPANQLDDAREIDPDLIVVENDPMVFFRMGFYFGKRKAIAEK